MKECRFCHWLYTPRLEADKAQREAIARGFCGKACAMAWDYEKELALRRAGDGWKDTGAK